MTIIVKYPHCKFFPIMLKCLRVFTVVVMGPSKFVTWRYK